MPGGAPKGNKFAVGNPGGGRKSAYQEMASAEWLAEAFFKNHTTEELLEMAKAKSISSVMVKDALSGRPEYVLAIFRKLFPDLAKSEVTVKDLTDELA